MAAESSSRSSANLAGLSDTQTGLEASLRKLIALRQQQQDRLKRLQTLLGQAIQRLAQELLPDLGEEGCARTAHLTGLDALMPPKPQQRLEEERERLEVRSQRLMEQELFQQATALVDPESGQLILRLHSARQRLRQAEDRLGVYSSHPSVYQLMALNFGTPEYSRAIWHWAFWQDHREAKRLVRLFGEDTFESLAARVRSAEAEHQAARSIRVDLEAQVREVHALIEEVERTRQALASLETGPAAYWQGEVRGVLERAELARLARRTEDPSVLRLLTLISALRAKKTYLEELLAGPFQEEEQRVQAALARVHDVPTDGPWRPWSAARESVAGAEVARGPLGQGAPEPLAWIVRCMSLVYEFAGYDFISLASDPLWWDVFTMGQEDGSMLPSVRDYYEAHPGYRCDELGLPVTREEDG